MTREVVLKKFKKGYGFVNARKSAMSFRAFFLLFG
jgi:hypothetical protein